MKKLAMIGVTLALALSLAAPALAWVVRVRPAVVVRVPAVVVRPAPVVVRPKPVVVVKPVPVCPAGWHWSRCQGRCLPNY